MKYISEKQLSILIIVALFFTVIVMSLNTLPSGFERGYDREIFRYMGMVIANGGMPYRDAFDHKPPIIYIIAALTHGWGPRGHWFFETFLLSCTAIVFFFFVRRERMTFAWLFPFLFILLLRTGPFYGDFLTRGFSSCFSLLAISLLGLAFPLHFVLAGFFTGVVFFTQQNDVLPIIPFFFYFLWKVDKTKCLHTIITFSMGVLLCIVPIVLWLVIKHSFSDFIFQAFIFNMKIYASPQQGFWGKFMAGFHSLRTIGFMDSIALASGLLLTGVLITRNFYLLSTVFFALGLAVFAVSMSGAFFEHYYLTIMPYMALLFGYAFREFREALDQFGAKKVLITFLAWYLYFILPVMTPTKRWCELKKAGGIIRQDYMVSGGRLTEVLEPLRGQRGSFLAFREPGQIALHTDYNVIAPTKYIYTHFWDQIPQHWDPDGKRFKEMLTEIEAYRPKVIVDFSEERVLPEHWQKEWEQYRNTYYARDKKMGQIFFRKN